MNQVKRLARKREYMQLFNNAEIAEQLTDTRTIAVSLSDKDKEIIESDRFLKRKLQNREHTRILFSAEFDFSLAKTFAEKRREAKRSSIINTLVGIVEKKTNCQKP